MVSAQFATAPACNATLSEDDYCRLGNELGNGFFEGAGNKTLAFTYYNYQPSFGGAVGMAGFAVLIFLIHVFQMIRKKAWYMAPLTFGIGLEGIGYIGRFFNGREAPWEWTELGYYLQEFTLLLAPVFFMLTLVAIFRMCVGVADGDHLLIFGSKVHSLITTALCLLSLVITAAGAGVLYTATTPAGVGTARNIIMGGLAILIIGGNFFLITGGLWIMKIKKNPTTRSLSLPPPIMWFKMASVAVFCSMLIMIRTGYRMIVIPQLVDNTFMARQEMFFLGAEAAMMIQLAGILNWFHPTRILNMDLFVEIQHQRSNDPYSHDTELGQVSTHSYDSDKARN